MTKTTDKEVNKFLEEMHQEDSWVIDMLDNIAWKAQQIWYNIKCWWNPYNVIEVKTLPQSWTDVDHKILHACFQLLVDFVEKEMAQDIVDWDWNEEHRNAKKEIMELYDWWKNDPFASELPYDKIEETKLIFGHDDDERAILTIAHHYYGDSKENWVNALVDAPDYVAFKEDHPDINTGFYFIFVVEAALEEIQNNNLKRLVDVRRYLWT